VFYVPKAKPRDLAQFAAMTIMSSNYQGLTRGGKKAI
jgi:hypothetical protein